MTPAEARDWIAGLQILGMRLGLERIHALLGALGHPERAAPALHVVGTNGKSSTARLAAAALAGQGLTAGAYLSPHVGDWTERVQVGGEPIGDAAFAEAASAVREAAEGPALPAGDPVTQFEALTAIAFCAFRRAGVAAMAIEAGLGGRWDATNVLQPDAAVALTNIALEHTEFLGDTEAAIAAEKLAVCADGADRVVVGRLSDRARPAVEAELARRRITALRYGRGPERPRRGRDGRRGDAARALPRGSRWRCAARTSATTSPSRSPAPSWWPGGRSTRRRCAAAVAGVRMPGRLEVVPGAPAVVLDGAHNPAGAEALARELPGVVSGDGPVVAVVSILDYKDAAGMLDALAPAVDLMVATRSSHPAAADPGRLAAHGPRAGRGGGRRRGPRRRARGGARGGRGGRHGGRRGLALPARGRASAGSGGSRGTPC